MVSLLKKIGTALAEPLHSKKFTVTTPLPDLTNGSKFAKFTLSGATPGTIPLPEGCTGIEVETDKSDITIAMGEVPGSSNASAFAISAGDLTTAWNNGVMIPQEERVAFTVGGSTVLHVKPLTGGTITVHAF
tara:strand:+ start:862 stop:1257 length:396 start_codon:yes stop_codon:yes gene_type:complete